MIGEKGEIDRANRWRCLALFLLLTSLIFLAVIIYMATEIQKDNKTPEHDRPYPEHGKVKLGEPSEPSVFHDLTTAEIRGLVSYLTQEESLNITRPPSNTINTNYRYLAELYLPNKAAVLEHLDRGGQQPAREAIVTIFRGAKNPPDAIERLVGPLPNPTYIKEVPGRPSSVPFILRPINMPEYDKAASFAKQEIDTKLRDHIRAFYGAALTDCGSECLILTYFSSMSPKVSGEQTRKFWFWLSRDKENYLLNNLDFSVLVNTANSDFALEKVWFRGSTYDGIDDFKSRVFLNSTQTSWPDPNHDTSFSMAEKRGKPFWDEPLRNPAQVEPDGKRYNVNYNQVTYMRWQFDFRMSSAYGPQVYDIRYDGQRIIYEIGLQEMCVFYSANNPAQMFADFFDSSDLIGPKASPLVPGVDCPSHATFIDASFLTETSDEPFTTRNVFCVFELNTGDPHRRHFNYEPLTQTSYEGMESILLVFRTILTVMNYDYIIDFRFFQNSALEVRVVSTGFISTSYYRPEETPYGYRLNDYIVGSLHHHLIHFKVDLDVLGTSNRFATLDIEPESVDNTWSKINGEKYHQTKFSQNVKPDEMSAAYKYDFNSPKYLTFYNNASTNKYGVHRSYRVLPRGMTKSLLAEGFGNEPSASWSRYQMAVTRRKETEPFSSSQYAALDTTDPVVKFQDFLDDNESILDEDLVAWLTVGMHHIPHTEDLPVTPTPGMDVGFLLLPFNYFSEDAGVASRNAIRIEPHDRKNSGAGLKVERYGVKQDFSCRSTDNSFWDDIARDSTILFESDDT
ncbi:putative amine oxidase [copper-containing] [Mizuhopecten yessoensis]|uniref:Amine oxidase n=1 Tax=Mizuhopecten yessoensis TaxID=6573 RepID=A0A210Q6W1_MIZYE|nr:putative amine oxidase [copper-containing] [Mizuhopecten yessoensis]XP_021365676.1 putative amine oxidase [copper-containing] [Mizuhopecten yessoensis]OWF44474.1 amine oxidase [copper-containing] [Mizuhopecten yessoensis]